MTSLLRATALACVGLVLTACAASAPETVRIGVPVDHPGLSLAVTGLSPENVGLESAIGRYLARDLGEGTRESVTFVAQPARTRFAAVAGHQVAFALGTDPVPSARADLVTAVGPYLVSGLRLAGRRGDVSAPSALGGKTVCVVIGSSAERHLPQLVPGAVARPVQTISTCLTDVVEKRADAALEDGVVLAGYRSLPAYASLDLAPGLLSHDEHMVLVPKDRPEICRQVTTSLRRMVSSGAWLTAVQGDLVTPGILDAAPPAPAVRGCD